MGDSKIVSGKEVRAHPSHFFLIILLYGAMGFFWPRTDESCGVENTLSFSSARSAFFYLTVTPSASRSLSKCRLRVFKMETLNSVLT